MELSADNLSIDPEKGERLSCESCGTEFTCQAGQKECWCARIEIPRENLAKLRKDFKSCLCKDCLEKVLQG